MVGKLRTQSNNRGFTLIEIMVVVAILAAVLAVGVPKLFNTTTAMRTGIRKMAIMTRDLRNIARLSNSTMRIAMKLDAERAHTFWIESAPGNATLLSAEKQKELEQMTSIAREDEKPKNEFSQDARVLKKIEELPRGLYFENIEIAGREKPITEGMAYVHFFPQGLAEEAAIHFGDRKTLHWTLSINPLTGRAEVFERSLTLKEIREQ